MSSATPIRRCTPAEALRSQLCARLADARARTHKLFRLVRPQALYDRPIPERHRIVFYIGHLEAFDWNLLRERVFALPSFHPEFDRLFAFGIDPVDGGLPADKPSDWPSIEEIERYNRRVRETLDDAIGRADLDDPGQPLLRDGLVLRVAIEHRLMHAETLAYMLHQMPLDRKFPQQAEPRPALPRHTPRTVEIPAGAATLGMQRGGAFGWDNEFEEQVLKVPSFAIDAFAVTNGEFLEFMRAGGYEDRALWSEADWEWKEWHGIRKPQFWMEREGRWFYRGMFTEISLPLDWPVFVSHAEASAYARSKGKALPTEAQFQRAAYGRPGGGESSYPWGEAPAAAEHGNFDSRRWDPEAVHAHPAGASAFDVEGLLGDGWEWTSTIFGPLPGFTPFSFYPGYSADFFDGKHHVMKGGSMRTAACMLRRTFRNWFQLRYPYVYAKFRCVTN